MSEPVFPAVLHAILDAREERAAAIARMVSTHNATAVVITVNVPGPRKNLPWTVPCRDWGREAFVRAIQDGNGDAACRCDWQDSTPAGPEYRCVIDLPAVIVKRTAVAVEESCPMGRLVDIDVYDAAGVPLTRHDVGHPPRRCLLCNRPAHECGRSARHARGDIDARITEIIAAHRAGYR